MRLPGQICSVLLVASAPVAGQPLSISHHSSIPLAAQTTDQYGSQVGVSGLSGIAHVAGPTWVAVMDNSDRVVFIDVQTDGSGLVTGALITGAVTLDHQRDFEGIAVVSTTTIVLAEEGTPALHEYDTSGAWISTIAMPPIFAARRPNRGLESLCNSDSLWTANEEALTIDGPTANAATGTVVRLQRLQASLPVAQFAYDVDPMHGSFIPFTGDGQSGLSDLVALPNGHLLALERSLAFASPLYLTRIYETDVCGATDVSDHSTLDGSSFVAAQKRLLYSGGHDNLEGLGLGPELSDGSHLLLGVVDDGDPISTNTLVAFQLSGRIDPIDDWNGDGFVNSADFIAYLNDYNSVLSGGTHVFGDPDLADPQGVVNSADFMVYLNAFAAGC